MAIINNTYRFIFVHIPKTAGTSVTVDLGVLSRWCDLELGGSALGEVLQENYYKRFGMRKHSTAAEIKSVVGEAKWSQYFSFSLVRNPVDRVISTYRFLKHWREWKGAEIMNEFNDLNEFLLSSFFLTPGPDRIFFPQSFWVYSDVNDPASRLIDFVGRTESIERDVAECMTRAGVTPQDLKRITLRRRNVSRSKPGTADQISPEAMQRVVKRYAIDFARFEYPMFAITEET